VYILTYSHSNAESFTLGAESPELRSLKLDLTAVFTILRRHITVDDKLVSFKIPSQTRGNFKLFKP